MCLSDWSSDVCSSDLHGKLREGERQEDVDRVENDEHVDRPLRRSEERRVGKEWRSRWWLDEDKKEEDGRAKAAGGVVDVGGVVDRRQEAVRPQWRHDN